MTYELSEIKEIRKKYDLTQFQLAKLAGVSQSLIAKIEAGTIDPTYTKVRKIFDAIDSLGKKKELKASQIMKKNIISAKPEEDIKVVIARMRKSNISQMPVIEDHKCIGLVSESIILDAILTKAGNKIKEIMQDSPPIVSKNTSIDVVSNLLKFYPMIVVSDQGKLDGIITKSDVLSKVYSK